MFLDEKDTFLEEYLDKTVATTIMCKIVHVECLVQCLVCSRLLVKDSSFYLYFISTIIF